MSIASFARSTLLCALAVTPISLSFTAVAAAAASSLPAISGKPASSVTLPDLYTFQPTAKQSVVSRIKFDIRNKPIWAQFDETTGRLSGRPNRAQVGTYGNIVIRAINWYGYAALPAFSITVSPVASAPVVSNTPPSISGRPGTSVNVDTAYNFTPTASDANHNSLTFSIQGKPAWATFNTASGTLSGTPEAADVGTYARIVISVSDGKASATLPAFTVAVNQIATGNITVDWTPPTQNSDGTLLTNLAGYRVHYGTSPERMTQSINVTNPGVTSYVVDNLGPGTWYFAVTSYTVGGTESVLSGVIGTQVL